MKRTTAAFVLLVLALTLTLVLAACSPRNELVGKWKADQGGILLEFRPDGVLRMGEGLAVEVKYEVIYESTIRVGGGAAGGLSLSGDISYTIQDTKLILTVAGQPMLFTRVP